MNCILNANSMTNKQNYHTMSEYWVCTYAEKTMQKTVKLVKLSDKNSAVWRTKNRVWTETAHVD